MAIKLATSELDSDYTPSSSDTEQNKQGSDQTSIVQREALRAMYRAFQEQIDLVSLFVDSKIGEIQRRLLSLKKQCNLLIKQSQSDIPNSVVLQRVTNRKIEVYKKEIDTISKDLQDLSRFILLQKIAIRKLFKKFLKHSQYAQKQQLVDKMTCKFLMENPKSFTNANLKDLSTEMALLFDFLYSFNEHSFDESVPPRERQTSIHTLDSLQFPARSQIPPSPTNPLASRIATFDIISKKKGPRALSFWVHEDNLNEIKFFLSSEFKLITDESFLVEERALSSSKPRRGSNVKLRETRSSLNLNDNIPDKTAQKYNDDNNYDVDSDFTPETKTTLIWLNNSDNPLMTKNANSIVDVEDDSTPTFQADPYSQICLSTDDLNTAVLFTPVGGLRHFTVASLNQQLIYDLFQTEINDKVQFKKFIRDEYTKSKLIGNPLMAEISLNWVIENNVKPIAQVKSNRLRYITTNATGEKINCYISLDWGIKTSNDDILNLKSPESANEINFKHAILEIHFDSNIQDLPKSVQNLINSHLVYQVDQLNFSLNNYLVWNYSNNRITDPCIMKYIAPWFEVYDNQEIRKIPSIEEPEQIGGILLNKNEVNQEQPVQEQQNGYWNEFDNGSDFGGDDNNGFYLDGDNYDDENHNMVSNNGPGLGWISNSSMDRILNYANSLTRWIEVMKNGGNGVRRNSLLRPVERHYSIYNDESDDESPPGHSKHYYGAINSGETIKYANHDHVITFIYMTCLILAYLLSGIGIGLVIGLFQYTRSIGMTWMGATIIGIAMLALLISVLLSVAGVCLSMCRYQHAPVWHYAFIWTGVTFTSIGLVFGLTLFV